MQVPGAAPNGSIVTFARAVQDIDPVGGLTHNFYKYPARFSPWFARSAISAFTSPGDWVLDPFMGGGTTVVEAMASGRHVVGLDLNELSVFIARAKTTLISVGDADLAKKVAEAGAHAASIRADKLDRVGSDGKNVQNLSGHLWRIRTILSMIKEEISRCSNDRVRTICTAALLLASQRKLDCRLALPRANEIRTGYISAVDELADAALSYRAELSKAWSYRSSGRIPNPVLLHASCADNSTAKAIRPTMQPKLILTSPPYPGVHVLYHRWQILGRRETDAPYWIAGCRDGSGASFYTFGDRKSKSLDSYFNGILTSFSVLRQVCRHDSSIVQLMAFSNIASQLPRYLETMKQAGYSEVKFPQVSNSKDGRLWRFVPNRKWYSYRSEFDSSAEVVLIHQPSLI